MFARRPRVPYVCAQRLTRQRALPYSTSVSTTPLLQSLPSEGAAKLTNRRLISLHGPDVLKFLQGIVTNNIRPESRAGIYAAFLNAQGRVLNDVFLYPTNGSQWHARVNQDEESGYLIEVDAEQAETLFKHLKRHKLRSKFKLRLLDEGELNVWSVWKESDRWTAHTQSNPAEGAGGIALTDCRATGMGQRLLLPTASAGNGLLADVDEAPIEAYTVRRYLRGVAEGQKEIFRDESLPLNCNIDIMHGIDFKKGCYVGQELTIRTHHTGVVRRRILPVQLYERGTEPPDKLEYNMLATVPQPESGSDIRRDDKKRRATGKLIASVGNIGLGMCRLEQMSDLTVPGEGSSFNPSDLFLVQTADGRDVGIKAFVPDWLRGRVREPKIQKRVEA